MPNSFFNYRGDRFLHGPYLSGELIPEGVHALLGLVQLLVELGLCLIGLCFGLLLGLLDLLLLGIHSVAVGLGGFLSDLLGSGLRAGSFVDRLGLGLFGLCGFRFGLLLGLLLGVLGLLHALGHLLLVDLLEIAEKAELSQL